MLRVINGAPTKPQASTNDSRQKQEVVGHVAVFLAGTPSSFRLKSPPNLFNLTKYPLN